MQAREKLELDTDNLASDVLSEQIEARAADLAAARCVAAESHAEVIVAPDSCSQSMFRAMREVAALTRRALDPTLQSVSE